jgi:hypothetical protein
LNSAERVPRTITAAERIPNVGILSHEIRFSLDRAVFMVTT